jgi:hypothetical protein
MNKEQLIRRMIATYTEAIDWAKRSKCNTSRLMRYLEIRRLDHGLCRASYLQPFQSREWISKYIQVGHSYICAPPYLLDAKQEIVQSLETRLAVLQKELKKCR